MVKNTNVRQRLQKVTESVTFCNHNGMHACTHEPFEPFMSRLYIGEIGGRNYPNAASFSRFLISSQYRTNSQDTYSIHIIHSTGGPLHGHILGTLF